MAAGVSAETQLILDEIKKSSQEVEQRITSNLDNVKKEIRALRNASEKNATIITGIERTIEKHETKITNTTKHVNKLSQNQLKNSIVIRGFPNNNFDEHEVAQNITTICNLQYGFDECYKFSRNIGNDSKTNKAKHIHIMRLSFISNTDKNKVFQRLKEKGHFTLSQLLASCDEELRLHQIWIDHSLSKENLLIQKQLLILKREAKIEKFVMRSGTFVMTFKDCKGDVKTAAVYESEQLEEWFSMNPDGLNGKRPRGSDSSSPNGLHPALKVVKGNGAHSRKPSHQSQQQKNNVVKETMKLST